MREFKRVFSPKLLSLFAVLIIVSFGYQFVSFHYVDSFKSEYQKELAYYSEMSADSAIREIDEIEAGIDYENVKVTEEFFAAQQSRGVIRSQLEYIKDYPEYLDSVHSNVVQMKGLAIFNTDGDSKFNAKNIEKTDVDYPDKCDIELSLINTLSVETFCSDKICSLCVLVFLAAIIMSFVSERKNSLAQLVYGTSDGRNRLAVKRTVILFFASVMGVLFIEGASLAANVYLYGMPDFSVPVQSSIIFQEFTFLMNLRQYITLSFLIKMFGMFGVAMLMWSIISSIYHLQTAVIVAGAFLAVEYTAFSLIPDSYTFVIFRYINIFAFVNTEKILLKYLNINIFGHAVRGSYITLLLIPFLIIVCSVFVIIHSEKSKPIQKQNALLRIYEKLIFIFSKISSKFGLFDFELKKILWHQKGLIVVIILFVWCFGFMSVPSADTQMYDPTISAYQSEFQGEVTENTLNAIEQQIAEVNTWQDSEVKDRQIVGLTGVKAEAEEKLGSGLWLVNPVPAAMLDNHNSGNYQIKLSLIYLLAVILLCAGIFAFENQSKMNSLLGVTAAGKRKVIAVKIFSATVLTILIWLLISARELYLICDYTNNTIWLNAPIRSLEYFSDYKWNISILTYSMFFLIKRLLTMLFASGISMMISKKCKTVNSAIIISLTVLLFPLMLYSIK